MRKTFFYWLMCLFFLLTTSCVHKTNNKETVYIKPPISICFKFIIENKINEFRDKKDQCVTYKNELGYTSLMMAVNKDNLEVTNYLLNEKVDVNQVDNAGFSALTYATNKNSPKIVELLRKFGAKIELTQDNLTNFMMAVQNSSFQLIKAMNPTKEEINIKAEDGWTALYFAVARQEINIVKYLLEKGSCLKSRDKYLQTPYDFAKELKWKEGIKLLSSYKSDC